MRRIGSDAVVRRRRLAVAASVLVLAAVVIVLVVVGFSTRSPSLRDVRKVAVGTDPLTISVLGDSTGNDTNEWVALWAQDLGASRQVALHLWDAAAQAYRVPAITFGDTGGQVTIWNGSQSGATAAFPAARISALQPEEPDVVIYSFGHNNTSVTIGQELGATVEAVTTVWGEVPSAVILQNPGRGEHAARQAGTLRALAGWARQHDLPTIDVTAAFDDVQGQMLDDAHPNATGSRVWATVVQEALG